MTRPGGRHAGIGSLLACRFGTWAGGMAPRAEGPYNGPAHPRAPAPSRRRRDGGPVRRQPTRCAFARWEKGCVLRLGFASHPLGKGKETRKGNRSPQRHGGASAGRRRGEKHLPKAVGQTFAWAAPALREKKNRRTGQSIFGRGGKWTGRICCGAEGVPDGPAAGAGAPGMARKRRAGGRAGPFALLGSEPFCCRF